MIECEVTSTQSAMTALSTLGERLQLPINHFEGNYTCTPETAEVLESQGQVLLRYVSNPNGSTRSIAAVANELGNVVGLMPHPERSCTHLMSSADGRGLLQSFLTSAAAPTPQSQAGSATVRANA